MKKQQTIHDWIITVTLCLIGIITALPVLAVIMPEQTLRASYAVSIIDPMTLTLVQHRGVFQLMLGISIIMAAFYRIYRLPVALTALATKGSFTVMVLTNPLIRDNWPTWVAVFDISSIIILCLVAVVGLYHNDNAHRI